MRIGLATPVVIQQPGVASEWEQTADADDLARIAEAADSLGYHHLTCSEHVAVPVADAAVRGSTYWDPLATLAFLAAGTSRIRLATAVVVLGYHHPLEITKRYGTLDRISGGRLVLGVGVGSLAAEFELLGSAFTDRGPRGDDAIRALRASLCTPEPTYEGDYFRYGGMIVEPHAVQPRVPLWVGGRTRRSLRRAVELGDGWMPFGLRSSVIAEMLASVDLPTRFEVVLPCGPLDPGGRPDDAVRQVSRRAGLGATAVTVSISARDADHYCDQLAALREIVSGVADFSG